MTALSSFTENNLYDKVALLLEITAHVIKGTQNIYP